MSALTITPSSVLASSSGTKLTGVLAAGVTVTQGQALYVLTAGTIGLADANAASPANSFAGIALTAGSPGQPIVYCSSDPTFTIGSSSSSGNVVYLDSTTPGALTATYSDVASGSTVITVGTFNSASTIILSPVTGGVK